MLTADEKARLINKIKKCLRLSKSSNEHEAAAAMRQAQKLMEQAGVSSGDLAASEAAEAKVKAGAATKTPEWEWGLARTIADAMGCDVFFTAGMPRSWHAAAEHPATWTFVGADGAELIASYAWTVLYRKLKQARAAYIKAHCKRCKSSTKTQRADIYCRGWVHGVRSKVDRLAPRPEAKKAIQLYLSARYELVTEECSRKPLSDKDVVGFLKGMQAAEGVDLNRPMAGAKPREAITP